MGITMQVVRSRTDHSVSIGTGADSILKRCRLISNGCMGKMDLRSQRDRVPKTDHIIISHPSLLTTSSLLGVIRLGAGSFHRCVLALVSPRHLVPSCVIQIGNPSHSSELCDARVCNGLVSLAKVGWMVGLPHLFVMLGHGFRM